MTKFKAEIINIQLKKLPAPLKKFYTTIRDGSFGNFEEMEVREMIIVKCDVCKEDINKHDYFIEIDQKAKISLSSSFRNIWGNATICIQCANCIKMLLQNQEIMDTLKKGD